MLHVLVFLVSWCLGILPVPPNHNQHCTPTTRNPAAWPPYRRAAALQGPPTSVITPCQIGIANARLSPSSAAPLITSCLSVACWGASIRV
ncbi:hypothetical protein COCVIDRAFT_101701 [Bipolaris victoriae FI3]|uniref:Secreted protein n=2 Tax=Bipolaris TaxID=33194 RepID=W6YBH5_COCC2|nr:uncharacterized protein COCCADRAFT_97687 [Bipolaris zeicola 26-R-13]XP_014555706.1 hypothetical protein COCVIDRAFT_101701 [Bipolaris victoriae FI3]EUC32844.1 hypothetical protein COCCADRAFT_97687 [Bipolaris zeicola 26-R-13]